MEDKKQKEACYQPDHLWTHSKEIKELHKITSMPKKDVWSWLAKQALWQVYISLLKEKNHPCDKNNEQHKFDLLYVPHNVFKRKIYKYILTGGDVASRYKVPRVLKTK